METGLTAIVAVDLGRRRYGEVLELQRELCRARIDGRLDRDVLLMVEHDPVITLGRSTKATSLPLAPDLLTRRGVEVFEVERGGDVTLHAPGQLVGYPILDLAHHRKDLHWYLRQLEETLIQSVGAFGIPAERRAGLTGVWTRDRKIASIGIHVKQWVTFHGFALNVTTDLSLFDLIVPCGIHGVTMTSIAREAPSENRPDLAERVRAETARAFGVVFEREVRFEPEVPSYAPDAKTG
ncbi:MAG: lipoyl(octanoyl) transferase LipB [Gemmatimonadota bacterium]